MNTLTVASYNIHRCIGRDGRHDPDRIAAVIEELAADVVGLQELDCQYHVTNGPDQLMHLAEMTGLTPVWAPVLHSRSGHYGNGLLTRYKVRAVRRIDLSVSGRERRGALDVDLDAHGDTLRVVVAHLGLRPHERRRQVSGLLKVLGGRGDRPLVLLGDFNEWLPSGAPLRRLHRRFGHTPGVRSWPSGVPLFALDRVWVQPRSALVTVEVHTTKRARTASDHLPVRAVIANDESQKRIWDQSLKAG